MSIFEKIISANKVIIDGLPVEKPKLLKFSLYHSARIIIADGVIMKDRFGDYLPKKCGDKI